MVINVVRSQAAYDCFDAYSCVLANISETNGNDVDCYGYSSCYQASLIQTFRDSTRIKCYGAYSCAMVDKIERIANYTISSELGYIICLGRKSCSNVNYISNDWGWISCSGEYSCESSIIYLTGSSSLYCNAVNSCSNSKIFMSNEIESVSIRFRAFLSAANAVITTFGNFSSSQFINFYFTGLYICY